MKTDRTVDLNQTVVVWIARISQLGDFLPAFEALLDERERERAARFHFPEDRARFVAGRGLLRHGLRRYAPDLSPTIELKYTGLGRPFFSDGENALQFSISHTGDLVGLAFTNGARVGIDLEYRQPALDVMDLAERIFSPEDFRTFQQLPHDEWQATFYRAWTRKEAYLKALGEGIATGLQDVSVSFSPAEMTSLTDTRDAVASNWRLHSSPVPDGYMGALACDEASRVPRWNHLQFRDGDIVLVPVEDHP